MNTLQKGNRFSNWVKTSTSLRMLVIGFLILILMIPLSFIKSLIWERKQRQADTVTKINKKWGEAIILYGPILKLPYYSFSETTVRDEKTGKTQTLTEKTTEYAYFFPNKLDATGDIKTIEKHLGMYTTPVYTADLELTGDFTPPNIEALDLGKKNIQWDKAQFIIKTTNLKGINNDIVIKLGETNLSFESDYDVNYNSQNQYDRSHTLTSRSFDYQKIMTQEHSNFSIAFKASGSHKIQLIPIGKETKLNLSSNWNAPSFSGEYSPYNEDTVNENGFEAHWKVLQMNRPFSQQFKGIPNLNEYAFGVDFIIPIDNFQQNERSAKYGYLMISLTFLLFFLIQTLSKINIHPFQYLMIGLALIIFYTLLVSISEHSDFSKAYIIAGTAVISLITLYSKSIMKLWKFPVFIGLSLTALYSFIYVIIQMENYALLVGSIGLFIILALVMYASRKIEWN